MRQFRNLADDPIDLPSTLAELREHIRSAVTAYDAKAAELEKWKGIAGRYREQHDQCDEHACTGVSTDPGSRLRYEDIRCPICRDHDAMEGGRALGPGGGK